MEYRRFGSNRSYMGTKRPLKRDLPDWGSGLRIITLVKGPFRGKSKQWPGSLVCRNALNRGNGLNASLLDRQNRRTSGN